MWEIWMSIFRPLDPLAKEVEEVVTDGRKDTSPFLAGTVMKFLNSPPCFALRGIR